MKRFAAIWNCGRGEGEADLFELQLVGEPLGWKGLTHKVRATSSQIYPEMRARYLLNSFTWLLMRVAGRARGEGFIRVAIASDKCAVPFPSIPSPAPRPSAVPLQGHMSAAGPRARGQGHATRGKVTNHDYNAA